MPGFGFGLGFGVGGPMAVAAAPTLPTFALTAETQAIVARRVALGAPMSTQATYVYDHWVRALKAAGVWSKLQRFWVWAETGPATCINWINPGTGDLAVVGTPTFTAPAVPYGTAPVANRGYNAPTVNDYLDTGVTLASMNRNNFSFGLYCELGTAFTAPDAGCLDGSNGVLLTAKNASNAAATMRAFSASSAISSSSKWDGLGLHTVSRASSTGYDGLHNGVLAGSVTAASVASVSTQTLTYLKANGFAGPSTRPFQGGFLADALTQIEVDLVYRAMRSIIESAEFGYVYINEAAYAPSVVNADVVVYGWTAQGVTAAYEAARQGKTVALVGGWRDVTIQQVGGVSANGLGATDLSNIASIGGLPRVFYRRTNLTDNRPDTSVTVRPRTASWIFRQMMDPTRTGGMNVALYSVAGGAGFSANGYGAIASVQKSGIAIASITTTDGRTFAGKQFIDATYEGDLMRRTGVSFITGREAAGTGKEVLNGWRGTLTASGSNLHQFSKNPSSNPTLYVVDPYITPGVQGSGLIYGVTSKPAYTVGQADGQTQAYNFRLTFSDSGARQVPFTLPSPPDGYLASKYEALGRLSAVLTAASTSLQIGDMLLNDSLGGNVYDFNNGGGMSTDLMGASTAYVAATSNATREVLWKDHEKWIRGLIYYALQDPDSRMAAAPARGQLAAFGWAADHYLDPHPNDQAYFPGQLYVREFCRLVNDLIWTGNDLAMADGTTPRSTNIVSAASYPMDSHHGERFEDTSGTPRLWNEGCMFDSASGGTDQIAPLPFEIFVPRASECSNLSVTFCVAATHVAFGAIRMEATAMATAQAMGMAAAIAIEKSVTIQAAGTTYYASDLRPRLLASPTLAGEVPPVLPQVN